jgi:hypothetical protein
MFVFVKLVLESSEIVFSEIVVCPGATGFNVYSVGHCSSILTVKNADHRMHMFVLLPVM